MKPGDGPLSSAGQAEAERSWLPWMVAACVVIAAVVMVTLLGGRAKPAPPEVDQTKVSALDPYAAKLLISGVKMSEASNFAGSKVTYVEGQLTNKGDKTLTGVTIEVVFRNSLGEIAQKEMMPAMLIRTREPYIDTEPVEAAPIKPGSTADFRLVFDHLADDWNQQYPELRVTGIQGS